MPETNFAPRLGEIFESTASQVNLFRGINSPGYVIGDIAITPAGATYEWDGDSWNSISISGGGGGAQTPWAQDIDGGGFNLANVGIISSGLFGGDAVLVTSLTGEIEESTVGAGELGFLTGVTSALQTQLNLKASLGTNTFTALQTITQATANAGILGSTGYSLTGSNATSMLDFSGTWNTSGNPVALKLAISNTASGATSKFLSFLAGAAGATEVLSVDKAGVVSFAVGSAPVPSITFLGDTNTGIYQQGVDGYFAFTSNGGAVAAIRGDAQPTFAIYNGSPIGFSSGTSTPDTFLFRDAANTLALRNSTTSQSLRIYNTFTTLTTAGEWLKVDWKITANQCRIGTVRGSSSGTARVLSLDYGTVESSPTAAITIPITSGPIVFGGQAYAPTVRTDQTTVANLPAAATAGVGAVAYVTDAVSQVFGATVTGGGSVPSPVYSDGTVWRTG